MHSLADVNFSSTMFLQVFLNSSCQCSLKCASIKYLKYEHSTLPSNMLVTWQGGKASLWHPKLYSSTEYKW